MKALILVAVLSVSGCATCSNHPIACSVAGAVFVGSVAATVAANSSNRDNSPQYHQVVDIPTIHR